MRKLCLLVTLLAFMSGSSHAQIQAVPPEVDNGVLTLKLDLTRGGAIAYLSLSGSSRNIVNIADEGRYIQQSYYAGKSVDRKSDGQSPSWSPWSWNPIQVGDKPFTMAPPDQLKVINLSSGFWGRYDRVSEHWMAFVDSSSWGMGIYNPRCTEFLAGMAGSPGKEDHDGSTSYIAPVKKEMLSKDAIYEYEYYVIIGPLQTIRNTVYKLNDLRKDAK